MMLNVSDIDFIPIKPRRGLLGFANFVINDSLFIGDIAVHSRLDGMGIRLVYPSKKLVNGKLLNIVNPINKGAAQTIQEAVNAYYQKNVNNNLKKQCEESYDYQPTNKQQSTK